MASSPITVPGLPAAAPLTGAEQMPFHQNGRLVRATPEVVVNGVPITPTGGTVGQSISDIAQRVFSPYDKGAVSDAVIASDGTATASLSAAENTARLQAYFNECRDRRLPWVLPLGNWLVDKGITAYGPGVAYGKILAPNDGTPKAGGQPWGAAFELAPYPEDILVPPTLAEIKTWTGCVRGATQIGGLTGRKDQYITVLTEDQLLVDRRDGGNTNPAGPLNVPPPPTVANPMFFGQGFLVTSDEGQIAAPLIEDWQQAAWQPGTTTITAQRVRPTIDVVLPDVVLIGPAAANVQDKGGRRAGIRITCCNVNTSGGSIENLTPQVPPLQGFSRANCCNVRQDGARVFSLGNAGVTYGFNQNLTYNIQDINCSAYGCRRDWDSTRGTDAHVERCNFPDGVGSHYHVRAHFKSCEISCRVTGNPQLIAAAGGDWTFEDCGFVLPAAFATVFTVRADIFKFSGSLHFKGRNRFTLFGGDSPRLVLINLRGPATNTGYDTGIVSEMPSSIVVDKTNTIWVTGKKSDGTLSNPALDLLVMGNGWDSYQSKDIRVGGRMYFGPQVQFDNPAPLPGMMVPADPSDPDSETVTIGAGFPKCKIRYINSRKFIGGYYDLTVEGLPDFSAEIFSDTNGSKDLGRVNLDVVGVRGQKRISSTFGGTRKTYIETRDAETVTFEVPPFGAGFDALGDENSNRTYDQTQISAAYGGDVTAATATAPDGSKPTVSDLTKFFYSNSANPLPEALQLRVAAIQAKAAEDFAARSLGERFADSVNAISFGVRPDCRTLNIAIGTTAGSTTVQVPSGTFTASDVGKCIELPGARTPTPSSVPPNPSTIFNTKIAAILSPTAIQIADPAEQSVTYNTASPVSVTYGTDNREAYRSASIIASLLGRGVYTPPLGVAYINSTLNLNSNVRFYSDGAGATLRAGAAYSIFSIVGRSNITIERINFVGRLDAPLGKNLVAVAASERVNVRLCSFRDHKACGLLFTAGSPFSGAEFCHFYNCGYHSAVDDVSFGVSFFGPIGGKTRPEARAANHHNYFRHNIVDACSGIGISLMQGFQLVGNLNYARLRNGQSSNYYIASCDGVVANDNVISCGPHGGHGLDIYLCRNVEVVGNVLWFCGGSGINLGNVQHFTVTGNICFDNWQSYNARATGDPVADAADVLFGYFPSVSRAGIVLDTDDFTPFADDPQFTAAITHGTIAANHCFDTGATLAEIAANPSLKPKVQQYGLQVIANTVIDWATVWIDSSNAFSGNAISDINDNYTYSGTRALRAPAQPSAIGVSGLGTIFDADRADLATTRRALKAVCDMLEEFGMTRDGVSHPIEGASFDYHFAKGLTSGLALSDLTFSRASTATDLAHTDGGVAAGAWTTFASGVIGRSSGRGLMAFESRPNYVINATTPVNQTTTVLPTGAYVLWVLGTGSATVAAGTATIDAGGTATTGQPFRFNVTASGTATLTVAGSLLVMQLEKGTDPTFFIPSGAAPLTRSADQISLTGTPFNNTIKAATAGFFTIDYVPLMPTTYANVQYLFSVSDGTTANRISVFRQGADIQFRYNAAGAGTTLAAVVGAAPMGRVCKIGLGYRVGKLFAVANGTLVTAATPPSALPANLSALYIGASEVGTTNQANGLIRRLAFQPFLPVEETAQRRTRQTNAL